MAWPEDEEWQSGLATTFGYNDPSDPGIGAWGYDLSTPDAYGVSLSREALTSYFGDEDKAEGHLVEVINPTTGASIIAPIVDKGPAQWVEARQGPTIDLTEKARRDIGNTGMDQARWRIIPDPPGGFTEDAAGPPTAIPPPPEGFTEDVLQPTGATAGGLPPPPEGFTEWDVPENKYGENLNKDLTQKLYGLELAAGVPLKIESGYRDPEHNARVGGAKGSEHIHGNAVDVDTSDWSQEEKLRLIEQASAQGITGIGVYNNNLHFDVGERRTWGPDYSAGSVPEWAQTTAASHMRGEFKPEQQAAPAAELPPPPEGFTEVIAPQEPAQQQLVQGSPAPTPYTERFAPQTPEAKAKQEAHAANRKELLGAINATEAAGYKVPHFIGKPDEPEGDRAPTMDMENLVGALQQQEQDLLKKGDTAKAAEVGKQAIYWSNKVRTEGMGPQAAAMDVFSEWGKDFVAAREQYSAAQQAAGKKVDPQKATSAAFQAALAGLDDVSAQSIGLKNAAEAKRLFKMLPSNIMEAPPETQNAWFTDALRNAKPALAKVIPPGGFKPEIPLGVEMGARAAGLKGDETLPRMSALDADRLGLPAWRDLETGQEVRRAGKPEERAAIPVHGATPSPTPVVPKKYEGLSPEAMEATLEGQKPDYRPEWAPPALDKATEDYRPEWAPPAPTPETGQPAWRDTLNAVARGGSDKGLLMGLEGLYRFVEARTKDVGWLSTVSENAKRNAEETGKMRERVRGNLPVDKDFNKRLEGIAEGAGQLLNLPLYAVPGAGEAVTVGSLYQEAREDYIDTRKKQGLPVDEKEADAAAWKYMTGAGIAEVIADRFIVGRFFKAAKASGWSIGETVKSVGKAVGSGSLSEGAQRLMLNGIAKWEGYDRIGHSAMASSMRRSLEA